MEIFEKFDTNQQYASANKIKIGNTIYVREEYANQQLAEKDKEIKDLKEMNDWYKMWHKKFQKQVEELTTELETYRPTKLTGEGQTICHRCKEGNWTCFGFYHYKGQTLCDKCLKEIYHCNDTRESK